MEDCIFCKIVKKEIPAQIVYEDDDSLAFLDAAPVHPGHTLVIPKKHSKDIFDISEEDFSNIMKTVQKITPAVKEAVKADGINIGNSNGKAANQAVFHLHVHIMPRYEGDGFKMFTQGRYKEREAGEIKEKIKSLLK